MISFKNKKILSVLAHPDDEVLGCGGTIAKAIENGSEVIALLSLQRKKLPKRSTWNTTCEQFINAAQHLGATPIIADNPIVEESANANLSDLIKLIDPYVEQADIIITHSHYDVHHSHRLIAQAVEVATRPYRRKRWVLQCSIPTSTDQSFFAQFPANLYVELSEHQAKKKAQAMDYYLTEQAPGRNSESLLRSMQVIGDKIGVSFAEEFKVARAFL